MKRGAVRVEPPASVTGQAGTKQDLKRFRRGIKTLATTIQK
jgi:hypothetical protein